MTCFRRELESFLHIPFLEFLRLKYWLCQGAMFWGSMFQTPSVLGWSYRETKQWVPLGALCSVEVDVRNSTLHFGVLILPVLKHTHTHTVFLLRLRKINISSIDLVLGLVFMILYIVWKEKKSHHIRFRLILSKGIICFLLSFLDLVRYILRLFAILIVDLLP